MEQAHGQSYGKEKKAKQVKDLDGPAPAAPQANVSVDRKEVQRPDLKGPACSDNNAISEAVEPLNATPVQSSVGQQKQQISVQQLLAMSPKKASTKAIVDNGWTKVESKKKATASAENKKSK